MSHKTLREKWQSSGWRSLAHRMIGAVDHWNALHPEQSITIHDIYKSFGMLQCSTSSLPNEASEVRYALDSASVESYVTCCDCGVHDSAVPVGRWTYRGALESLCATCYHRRMEHM